MGAKLCYKSLKASVRPIIFAKEGDPNNLRVWKRVTKRDRPAVYLRAVELQSKTRLPIKSSSKKFWVCLGIETRNPYRTGGFIGRLVQLLDYPYLAIHIKLL